VTNQSDTTSRPLIWEDDAPAASRYRRVQQGVPRTGRALPGMPLDMDDADGDELPRSKWGRNGAQGGRWYWPSGTVGRVFVGLGVIIFLALLFTAADLSKIYLQRDARFRIAGASHIQAVGLTEVTRMQLLPVFGEDIGRNVFFVPLNERRKQLEAIPWIQQATVIRLLPDQIRVDIVERKPVAFTRHGQQVGLVDESGVLLDMAPAAMAAHHYSFPVLTGIDAGDKPASRQARMAVYGRMMSELDGSGQRNSEQLSEIDLTDPEDARVLMPEQGTDILAHFGEDRFLERYQRYKDHIAEWRQQYPNLSAVDLRYEHQVVLEMASGASHAQPNAGAPDAKSSAGAKPADAPLSANAPVGIEKPKNVAKAPAEKGAHDKTIADKPSTTKPATAKPTTEKAITAKASAPKPGVSNSGANKPGIGKAGTGKATTGKPGTSKVSETRSGAKKPLTASQKAKANAAKAKAAKAAANRKHAAGKTSTQSKTSATHKAVAPNKTIAQAGPKPKPLAAARPTAAEGQ
jgi:cell division protein FtsQ